MSVARRALLNPAFDEALPLLEERRQPLYFARPYGKRISEYEQVLLHAQPNPDWIAGGIGQGAWTTAFPGGRGAWENYFTEARTSDWFVFRDPEGRWQRPYVAEKADGWRELQRSIGTFTSQRAFRDIDTGWAETALAGHLGALGLHDYGAFMALAAPIRDCLVDTLRAAIVSSSLDFLDNAQVIQAEKVYLAQVIPSVRADVGPSKQLWLEHPAWRGARALIEELWGRTYDHIEILFALHVLHEPLFGRLVRQQFFTGEAGGHGDLLTPRVLSGSARAGQAAQGWIVELFGQTLGGDPVFGDYNRKLMRYWAEKWLPLEVVALQDLGALPWGSAAAHARGVRRVVEDWAGPLASLFQADLDPEALVSQATAPAGRSS